MENYLVIGGSSGIGYATTKNLLNAGSRVYATYNSNEINSDHKNLFSHHLDVNSTEYDLEFLPEHLDGFVFCPGTIKLKPFPRIKPEDFLEDYNFQVVNAIRLFQAILPKLKKSPQASVVFFSTVAVQSGFNFHTLISSTKGALEGLTRALSAELAPNIRVNCIAPSLTETPLAATLLSTEQKREANAERHPLKRVGSPEDIAAMAAFLLSDKSSWITGQILHVDGGISIIK